MLLPWVLCGVLSAVSFILCMKIHMLKVSMAEIRAQLADWLKTDTNTLISISSSDRQMRLLASDLNRQLRLLRRQRRRYLDGDRELKDAVTNISHDLRTPLTAISGYLDLLRDEEKSEKVTHYVMAIQNRAEILKQLTEELFRYSMTLSSEESENLEELPLNRILEDSLSAYYAVLKGCRIVPEVSMPDADVCRRVNRSALIRIFANILSNAVKYSDGDLAVTLRDTGELIFQNHASSLTEVEAGRLFDRFYTVENAAGSTGLGLSIAKTLAEQMGGSIGAEYRGGEVRFRVWLTK